MNRILIVLLFSICIAGCKSKKKKPEVPATNFFPVPVYIKGELARLDTAQYSFLKVETINNETDSMLLKNTEVKAYAKDFTELPDISSADLKDNYEVDHLYDDMLNAFVFTFTTKEDLPVKKEIVVVDPEMNAAGKNDIKSVFVELWQNTNGSTVRKNMLWEEGKSFQITTVINQSGKPEEIKKLQVIWNGFDSQNK